MIDAEIVAEDDHKANGNHIGMVEVDQVAQMIENLSVGSEIQLSSGVVNCGIVALEDSNNTQPGGNDNVADEGYTHDNWGYHSGIYYLC